MRNIILRRLISWLFSLMNTRGNRDDIYHRFETLGDIWYALHGSETYETAMIRHYVYPR